MLLEMTGNTLYPIDCIETLITRRTASGKNINVLTIRFRLPLLITEASEVPSIILMIVLPPKNDTAKEKMLHTSSIPITFLIVLVILSVFPAPKFWLTKVAVAVAIVDMGIMRNSYTFRDEVCAVISVVPRPFIAL